MLIAKGKMIMRVGTIVAFSVGIAIASAAQAAPPTRTQGCDAVDLAGKVFTDSSARVQMVVTKKGVVNTRCQGHLPSGAELPPAPVEFTNESGTGFVCFSRWSEVIDVDGSFTLTCHFRPAKS